MNIIFMGTPSFAVPALRELAQVHEVCAVVTRPDAVSGRGKRLLPSPVKLCATEIGIDDVIETKSLRSPELQERLATYKPDCIVVAAFGCILPVEVLEIPRFGCINIHASTLPRWRGAAPIQRAILQGDERAGVSIMRMEQGLDTGAWCAQGDIPIKDLSSPELTELLAIKGGHLLISALTEIESGTAVWIEQDERFVTYADKLTKDEVLLFPELTCKQLLCRVRASSDSAPSRCVICGRQLRVLKAAACDDPGFNHIPSGAVHIRKGRVFLGCIDGTCEVLEVKPDGKGIMEARAWSSGVRDAPLVWGSPEPSPSRV